MLLSLTHNFNKINSKLKVKDYQSKFVTEKEAVADAKQMSIELKKPIAVIKSKKLYYSDSNTEPHSWEELMGVYKDGKKA